MLIRHKIFPAFSLHFDYILPIFYRKAKNCLTNHGSLSTSKQAPSEVAVVGIMQTILAQATCLKRWTSLVVIELFLRRGELAFIHEPLNLEAFCVLELLRKTM